VLVLLLHTFISIGEARKAKGIKKNSTSMVKTQNSTFAEQLV